MEIKTYGQSAVPVPTVEIVPVDPPVSNPPPPVDPDVPTASFSFVTSDLKATLNASGSRSISPITQYNVAWGDGSTTKYTTPTNLVHTYTAEGSYSVTLTVVNSVGHSDDITIAVPVTAPTPNKLTSVFTVTTNGLQVTVDARSSTDVGGTINKYVYSWGDGQATTVTTNTVQTHTYAAGGAYKVTVTVSDSTGATSSAVHSANVTAPFAQVRMPSTMTPTKTAVFKLPYQSPMQAQAYDQVNNHWFVSQNIAGSSGTTTPYETTAISRLTASGSLIDTMTLVDAGHGMSIIVENVGTKVYLWITYDAPAVGSTVKYETVRFPYTAGKFTRDKIAGLTVLPSYSTYFKNYTADWEAGWLLERINTHYRRRKISEFLAGIDQTYSVAGGIDFNDFAADAILQGFDTLNDCLFVYAGRANGDQLSPPDYPYLYTFDWNTGKLLDKVNLVKYGSNPDGTWAGGQYEPEGLGTMRDPKTKTGSLLFGVDVGPFKTRVFDSFTYKNIASAP